ncbi:MAG: hypothetical protein DMD82_05415, partial [Candidatus Rokuibacteriota bacterium]
TAGFAGDEVVNATVSRNTIDRVTAGAAGSAGILVARAASGTNTIVDNLVGEVVSSPPLPAMTAGIAAGGGGTTRVWFNSVGMSGSRAGAGGPGFALAVGDSASPFDVRDNVLSDTQTGGVNCAIGVPNAASFASLTSDWNDLYAPGGVLAVTGGLANQAAGARADLAAWRAATGKDANSISGDPLFVSAANLHITSEFSPVANAGQPIAGVIDDIDGEAGSRTTLPDIGADEFQTWALRLQVSGSGALTKNPDQPSYAPGAVVTLTATPAVGWHFVGWSGDAAGATNPLQVTMDGHKAVTAAFAINTYTLDVSASAGGTVTKNPNQTSYDYGTTVTLTAAPATGYHFVGWSGDTAATTTTLTLVSRQRHGDQDSQPAHVRLRDERDARSDAGDRLSLRGLERRHRDHDQSADADRDAEPLAHGDVRDQHLHADRVHRRERQHHQEPQSDAVPVRHVRHAHRGSQHRLSLRRVVRRCHEQRQPGDARHGFQQDGVRQLRDQHLHPDRDHVGQRHRDEEPEPRGLHLRLERDADRRAGDWLSLRGLERRHQRYGEPARAGHHARPLAHRDVRDQHLHPRRHRDRERSGAGRSRPVPVSPRHDGDADRGAGDRLPLRGLERRRHRRRESAGDHDDPQHGDHRDVRHQPGQLDRDDKRQRRGGEEPRPDVVRLWIDRPAHRDAGHGLAFRGLERGCERQPEPADGDDGRQQVDHGDVRDQQLHAERGGERQRRGGEEPGSGELRLRHPGDADGGAGDRLALRGVERRHEYHGEPAGADDDAGAEPDGHVRDRQLRAERDGERQRHGGEEPEPGELHLRHGGDADGDAGHGLALRGMERRHERHGQSAVAGDDRTAQPDRELRDQHLRAHGDDERAGHGGEEPGPGELQLRDGGDADGDAKRR